MIAYVKHIPIVTTLLLESANVAQLARMWSERSALGQSVMGWAMVNLALILWFVYYAVMLPDQKLPRYCTAVGICINATVIATAWYFGGGV